MELTLTGGSTLSDSLHSNSTPLHSNSTINNNGGQVSALIQQGSTVSQSRNNNHSHGHNHTHGQGHDKCCNSKAAPRPVVKIDASNLLPSKEHVQRFKTDRNFRMNVLSNVVRGGPYALFMNLLTVLILDGEKKKNKDEEEQDGKGNAASDDDDAATLKDANSVALAQMLDGHGADGHTLTHWCAKRGDEPRFLAFLIEKSHAPNGSQLLIDLHMPSKDSVGMYPLHWAVTEGAIPLVSMLLQHLEERPSPPHHILPAVSSTSLIQDESEFASDNASMNPSNNIGIDAQDTSGCTPLLIASQYGHPDLAAFLIRRGANPHAVDSSRDTALHWAAYKGSVEVCGMLLHLMGVEGQLDAQDVFGQTPMHLASLRGNTETVRYLMEEAGSIGERPGSLETASAGRVGSKVKKSSRASFLFPGQLLSTRDKEEKTPKDLAIKKKKLGCELLLQEYEEQYLLPKRSIFSRLGQTCQDLCSPHSWKAWMGMSGSEMPIGQSPTFPFYWMTSHIIFGGIFYATEFVGLGGRRAVGDSALLWDKIGLHLFFLVASAATWWNLYSVYKTNPGVLDARIDNSSPPATWQLMCCNRGGYLKDKVSLEMESVTNELRRQYDDIIESYSKDFPSQDKRVQLCHTCRIVKPTRSKHCRVARRCVLVFDHHCPFVGTTVGLYNYSHFYLFLLSFCLMDGGLITAWIMFMTRSKEFPKGVFLMGGYLAMYLLPVGFMAFYHTTLVFKNISTNEQMNARKYRYFWNENGQFHNPFNKGIIRNILQRCWPDRSSWELELTGGDEERQSMLNNMV